MNYYAGKFGMKDTRYANPHGLSDPNNRSSAVDVAKLAAIFLQDTKLAEIVSTKRYVCAIVNKGVERKMVYENTNKMLDYGFLGVKTGITPNAGPCLCAAMRRNN